MMKYEFEEMVGKEVSVETYEIYEKMYMALPEGITKQQFVGMLNISAIPESEDAIERKRKAAQFRLEVLEKINAIKEDIESAQHSIKIYEEYANLGEDDAYYWRSEARHYRDWVKRMRAEIAMLKSVVA